VSTATTKQSFGLPLLAKELTEQANRPRTYYVRVAYMVVLYGSFIWLYAGSVSAKRSVAEVLGSGAGLFWPISQIMTLAICLLVPIYTCGSITTEKDRNTLEPLLLTKLSPFTILLEKLLACLIPMSNYLLMAMPLLAVCYSLGGVEAWQIFSSVGYMLLLSIELAAWCLMWSTICRSTVVALIMAIVVKLFMLIAVYLMFLQLLSISSDPFGQLFIFSVGGPLLLSVIWLSIGAYFLPRRSNVTGPGILSLAFRWLDHFFHRVNDNPVTKGIILIKDSSKLPVDQPIAWRETVKKLWGSKTHLTRMVLLIETPIVFFFTMMFAVNETATSARALGTITGCVIWVLGAVLLLVQASGLISSERSQQTLDLLLVSPLSAKDILLQKMAGVWRLAAAMLIPFATIAVIQFALGIEFYETLGRAVFFGCLTVVLLPFWVWFSVWIGLMTRNSLQAMLLVFGLLTVWQVGLGFVAQSLFPGASGLWGSSSVGDDSNIYWYSQTPLKFDDAGQWIRLLLLVASPLMIVWRSLTTLDANPYYCLTDSSWVMLLGVVPYLLLIPVLKRVALRRTAVVLGRLEDAER
jgi:ABC-type transport system involved in multi-copper enzyme maturation permease subunit